MREGPEIEELAPVSGTAPGGHAGQPRLAADARLGGSPRGVLRSVAIVIALIGLAIVKPWDALGGTGPAPTADRAIAPAPSAGAIDGAGASVPGVAAQPPAAAATLAEPVLAPGQLGCGAPDGWRLVTLGWLAGRPSSMQSAAAVIVTATGPPDPAIQSLPAGEAPVVAVGACEPGPAPGVIDDRLARPPVRVVAAWRVDRGTPASVPLRTHGTAATSAVVVQLYAPTDGSWGPGSYVLELVAAASARPVWVGFTVGAAAPAPPGSAPPGSAPP
jgi:hypothetical protein